MNSGESVLPAELAGFKDAIAGTLGEFRREQIATRERMAENAKRLEACLNETLFYEYLASSPALKLSSERSELAVVRAEVAALLNLGDVKMGALELLEKRLAVLKQAVDQQLLCAAYQEQLPTSLTAHLTDMGYEIIEEFAESESATMRQSVFRIPGGERVHVALHQNGQMAFEVAHERGANTNSNAPLSMEELGTLQRQEDRWCADFRELVRRLAGEGFSFTVNLERDVAADSVKVVVVETPDEILASDEEDRYHEEAKKRYLA